MGKCVICKKNYREYGNNAQPLADGYCCDSCNNKVIARRLSDIQEKITARDGSGKIIKQKKVNSTFKRNYKLEEKCMEKFKDSMSVIFVNCGQCGKSTMAEIGEKIKECEQHL